MRHLVTPLLFAHSATFLAFAASYFFCSKLLSPEQYGAYTAALAVGAFSILVLDGGIKTTVIKRDQDLSAAEAGGLLLALTGLAAALLAILGVVYFLRTGKWFDVRGGDELITAFAGLYIISYPWIGLSTALLERRLEYSRLARIEATSMVVERLLPIAFLVATDFGLFSFSLGLLLGRLIRLTQLLAAAPIPIRASSLRAVTGMFGEGLWIQLGGAAASIRDNLHVLLVGPLVGASWVGYYGWALQLCTIASQAFVQIAARVALPLVAQSTTWSQRWALSLGQIRILASATALALAATLLFAPWANNVLFDSKWTDALPVLALLCVRMLPGVACTSLTPLLLVERGTKSFAAVTVGWTAIELAAAAAGIYVFGQLGLAYSYAICAWAGAAMFLYALPNPFFPGVKEILRAILLNPSVMACCTILVGAFCLIGTGELAHSVTTPAVLVGLMTPFCFAVDRQLRISIMGKWT